MYLCEAAVPASGDTTKRDKKKVLSWLPYKGTNRSIQFIAGINDGGERDRIVCSGL